MATTFFILAVLAALGEWTALILTNRRVEYVTKPAVMVFLGAYLLTAGGLNGPLLWFGLGILFSLIGDVMLIVPEKRFIFGLAAFLLAHVAYVLGFNLPPAPPSALTFGIAILIGVIVFPLVRKILVSLRKNGKPRLVLPVQVYAVVIMLMLLSAILALFRTDWLTAPAVLVAVGATLFVTSDILLAWHLFVHPINHGRLINIGLYHLGQLALIAGAVGQFG
jgi:uncharacterized membrane protein YhhN